MLHNLSNLKQNLFTLASPTYYLQSYYNTQIYLISFNKALNAAWGTYLPQIEATLKDIQNATKTSIRLFIDNIEISDLAVKEETLKDLKIAEYRTENKTMIRSLSATALESAKKAAVAQAEVQVHLSKLQGNLNSLSLTQCERAMSVLKSLI